MDLDGAESGSIPTLLLPTVGILRDTGGS